jgi:Kef-type K+ transport system membrane component KefB
MEILYILLVLLIVARVFGEIATRLHQPALVGELIAGIVMGMVANHYAKTFPVLSSLSENEVFSALANLSVFFLMLLAGVEMRPKEVAQASLKDTWVAACGIMLPLALGMGLGWTFLPESNYKLAQTLFIGVALSITAVPVAAKMLMDMGLINTPLGKMIVAAAILDDVFSLILLSVLVAVIRTGEIPDWEHLGLLVGRVLLFFIFAIVVGRYAFPFLGRLLRWLKADEFEFSSLLIVSFAYAVLAEALHLHFILGAFFAGLFFSRQMLGKAVYEDVRNKLNAMTTGFFAPIFFASIGFSLNMSALREIPLFLFLLLLSAIVGKVLGAGLPAYFAGFSPREAMGVGFAMNVRGTMELIIADVALRNGLFSTPVPTPPVIEHLFSAIVIVAILTTITTPLILRPLLRRQISS